MASQHVDQVPNDVYGAKTLNNFLNLAAFAQPAAGGFGTSAQQHQGTGLPQGGSGTVASRILSGGTDRRTSAGGVQPVDTFNCGLPTASEE
jgi:hypothetical protein